MERITTIDTNSVADMIHLKELRDVVKLINKNLGYPRFVLIELEHGNIIEVSLLDRDKMDK